VDCTGLNPSAVGISVTANVVVDVVIEVSV